ncbi:MAG: hypothetical protein JXR76_18670 [Deltaproteobacteria bacterium]|nr:hypothetical protein [Deltaproteobacteria bacterium]
MKLSSRGQKWLKAFHVWVSCGWAAAGFILLLMNLGLRAKDGMELYGYNIAMKFIDDFIIIPCAMITLVTGIFYALLTKWGWFRHTWIIVKWIITVGSILFGTFFLGPWLNSLAPISLQAGMDALTIPEYVEAKQLNLYFGIVQVFLLTFAIFISIFKPWKKKKTS